MSTSPYKPEFQTLYSRLIVLGRNEASAWYGPWSLETPTMGVTPVPVFVHIDTGDIVPMTSVLRAIRDES